MKPKSRHPAGANADGDGWPDLESAMADLLADDRDGGGDGGDLAASAALSGLDDLSSRPSLLRAASRTASARIAASIASERSALGDESDDLVRRNARVRSLEDDADALRRSIEAASTRRGEAEASIPVHAAAAAEVIDEADELECRRVRELPKIKKEIGLYGLTTNIKWDYGRADVLAGEVAVPKRRVHRRFEIEKDAAGEFEIAERLWAMIEG